MAAAASNTAPCRSTTHAMRASLLAKATTAAFLCIRVNSPHSQLPRGVAPAASVGRTGSSAVDEQLSQILVAAFGDADQPGLAAGRHLTRHQSEPSREIAPTREGFAAINCGHQRRRIQHADARNGR